MIEITVEVSGYGPRRSPTEALAEFELLPEVFKALLTSGEREFGITEGNSFRLKRLSDDAEVRVKANGKMSLVPEGEGEPVPPISLQTGDWYSLHESINSMVFKVGGKE